MGGFIQAKDIVCLLLNLISIRLLKKPRHEILLLPYKQAWHDDQSWIELIEGFLRIGF